MITVIADDITGAAEMAGIGLRFGMRVALVINAKDGIPDADLLVYGTDTRSLREMEAMDETRRVVRQLKKAGCRDIFKKADSALRGHVVSELEVLMKETGLPKVLYLPENPSKGRVIRDGIYYIDGKPLNETFFSYDPEYPAGTSDVKKRLPGIEAVISTGELLGEAGIYIAAAETASDIEAHIGKKDDRTLLAGGADLFTAYLRSQGWKEQALPPFEGLGEREAIVVCGSTTYRSLEDFEYFKRKNVPMETMPPKVFELKVDPKGWFTALDEVYELHGSVAVGIGHPPKKGINYAHRLRNIMALAVSSLVDTRLPHELIIEGGSTAYAVLQVLGWNRFRVTDEIAPGVVRMTLEGDPEEYDLWEDRQVYITLKPGSYPWGDTLFS